MKIIDFIKNQENKQTLVTISFFVVVFATLLILYVYYQDKIFALSITTPPETAPVVFEVESIKLDTAPLTSDAFKELKKFGDYPLELPEEDFGRSNPFLPQ